MILNALVQMFMHTQINDYGIADDYKEAISTACNYRGKNVDSKQLMSDP